MKRISLTILTLVSLLLNVSSALAVETLGTIGGNGALAGELTAPTNFIASGSGTSISLSWDSVTNATGYEIFRDSVSIATTSSTSYTDSGLSYTTYTYQVRATAGSANSDLSSSASVTLVEPTPDPAPSGGGGGGGGGSAPAPSSITSSNSDLTIVSFQSGELDYTFADSSTAKLEIPQGAVTTETTFSISQSELTANQTPLETTGAFMIGGQVFNIIAKDNDGDLVKIFAEYLTITLTIPDMPEDISSLDVYYFEESTNEWLKVSGAEFNSTNKTATFSVSHLTEFAVFQVDNAPTSLNTPTTTSEPAVEDDAEGEVLGEKVDVDVERYVATEKEKLTTISSTLTNQVLGKILLQVEDHGEAWYVDPISKLRYYLANGSTAYEALRKFGLGITNSDLAKIPVGIEERFADTDTDGDGLVDQLEEGLGTDINKTDTDGDGVSDYEEVIDNNTNPLGTGNLAYNTSLINKLKGRIVLQVESHGEAWYINPADGRRYYMKDGNAAYQIMRFLSLGITNENIYKIDIGDL